MHHAVLDPGRSANGVIIETVVEGIAEIEAQLAQQRVKAQQAQYLPCMTGANIGNLSLTKTGSEDTVQRGNVRLPRCRAPVQIVIHIEGRSAKRRADPKEVSRGVQLVAFNIALQRGALFTRFVHPLASGSHAAKAGIHQPTREAQRIALNSKITVDTAIFLSPQPALRTAQLEIGPVAEIHARRSTAAERRRTCRLCFRRRKGRVVIEITDSRLPWRVIAHRQRTVNFTPLRLDL